MEDEKAQRIRERGKKIFENFIKVSDIPTYSYEKQNRFLELSKKAKYKKRKRKFFRKYRVSKQHKFVVNKLSSSLMFIQFILTSGIVDIPIEESKMLKKRTDYISLKIIKNVKTGMTESIVNEVIDIVKAMKKYL